MSGTSAFLRRSCWAKSVRKSPVSTPSRIKVCEIDSLIRGQDKILSTKESALENNFLFVSFLSESILYLGFCEGWYFGSSCFVTDWVIKLFCTQKQERGQTGPYQDKWLMTGGVITLMSCNPLSDARMSLLCFQVVRFRDNSQISLWNFATCYIFMLCRFSFSGFNMHSQRNRINSFGQDWRKRLLHLWEIYWNTWRVERFCVFIVHNFWLFQPVQDLKLWGNGSGVCTILKSVVCAWQQINQQMTEGNRRCISVSVN